MKPCHTIQAICLLIFLLTSIPAYSQGGPLAPPVGAPAPTMKTLAQVEPRIPLVSGAPGVTINPSGQINISQPGSYYLTGNVNISLVANGINISSNGVTLDLMGYSIRYLGAGFPGDAIYVNGSNVLIHNGNILSTTTYNGSSFLLGGFLNGIHVESDRHNITVKDLSIQGVRTHGIMLPGTSSLVENCKVLIAGNIGIANGQGIVKNSIVQSTGAAGIVSHSVIGCRVSGAVGIGINASVVANSSAFSTGASGINAVASVTGCFGESVSTSFLHHGIFSPIVTSSHGTAKGGYGIQAGIVHASRGISGGTGGFNSSGIRGVKVTNSFGRADGFGGGDGILGDFVDGSYGSAAQGAGNGITASLVTHSYGMRSGSLSGQNGISADQANSCRVVGGDAIVLRYNMP